MFGWFTPQARIAVVLSQEAARFAGRPYIGSGDLLLGTIRRQPPDPESGPRPIHHAFLACTALGITAVGIEARIAEVLGRGEAGPQGNIPFSKTAKKAMEACLREALAVGDNYIGTKHLLLGLTHALAADPPRPAKGLIRRGPDRAVPEYYDVAQQVLIAAAGSLDQVRAAVFGVPEEEVPLVDRTPVEPGGDGLGGKISSR